jgi:hypothetical protein
MAYNIMNQKALFALLIYARMVLRRELRIIRPYKERRTGLIFLLKDQ